MAVSTPCTIRGFEIGHFFVAKVNTTHANKHDILVLTMDDGTTMPRFLRRNDGEEYYLCIDDLVHVGNRLTPAARSGFAEGMVAIANKSTTRYARGEELELTHDDGSECPFWSNLSRGGTRLVADLRNVTKPCEFGFEEKPQNTENEEHDMGDYPNTPAGRMSLREGDQVRVTRRDDDLTVGTILTLTRDDNSTCPFFEDESGATHCPYLSSVEPINNGIPVGGPVKKNDILVLKSGQLTVISRDQSGPDSDNDYTTVGGYVGVSDIKEIHRDVIEVAEQEVEFTVKLPITQARKLMNTGGLLESTEISGRYSENFRESVAALSNAAHQALQGRDI